MLSQGEREVVVPEREGEPDYGCAGGNCTTLFDVADSLRKVVLDAELPAAERFDLDPADVAGLRDALAGAEGSSHQGWPRRWAPTPGSSPDRRPPGGRRRPTPARPAPPRRSATRRGLPPALTGSRDAVVVSTHEVTYQGPSSFAVRAAALIADSEGIELTSAARADDPDAGEEAVVLVLTVEGTDEAVAAGLAAVRAELPAGASVG